MLAREEGFVTAFPDYGGKTRSGLKHVGKQRIEEAHEETARRMSVQQAERRRRDRMRNASQAQQRAQQARGTDEEYYSLTQVSPTPGVPKPRPFR